MVDTPRTLTALIAASPDNSSGLYTNQNQRDFILSSANIVPQVVSAAGTTTTDATLLTSHICVVTVCAAGAGVRATLPYHRVYSRGANPVQFYPISGGNFEGLAADAPNKIAINNDVEMTTTSGTQSYLGGVAGTLSLIVGSPSYANDATAAAGGVPVDGLYRNGSVLQVRVT